MVPGRRSEFFAPKTDLEEIVVTATKYPSLGLVSLGDSGGTSGPSYGGGIGGPTALEEVVVEATKEQKPQKKELNPLQQFKNLLCMLPQVAGGAAVDAYAGLGGSIGGGETFNPRNGQLSISFDLGAGFGLGGGVRAEVGNAYGIAKPSSETAPLFGGGVNLNATAMAGGGATGSYQLVGSSRGDWSLAGTGGAEASVNANVSIHVQMNLPALYNLGCGK